MIYIFDEKRVHAVKNVNSRQRKSSAFIYFRCLIIWISENISQQRKKYKLYLKYIILLYTDI